MRANMAKCSCAGFLSTASVGTVIALIALIYICFITTLAFTTILRFMVPSQKPPVTTNPACSQTETENASRRPTTLFPASGNREHTSSAITLLASAVQRIISSHRRPSVRWHAVFPHHSRTLYAVSQIPLLSDFVKRGSCHFRNGIFRVFVRLIYTLLQTLGSLLGVFFYGIFGVVNTRRFRLILFLSACLPCCSCRSSRWAREQ